MNSLSITLLLGTAREGRSSKNVAEFIRLEAEKQERIKLTSVDTADYHVCETHPGWKPYKLVESWRGIAEKSDGFIIVSPEYNHGYPGELKLLLDSAYQEYFHKPVLLVGVSGGGWGGVRVVEHLKPVVVELGMTPLGRSLYFPWVKELFNDEGKIEDTEKERSVQERIKEALEYLILYAKHFRGIRSDMDQLLN